ncbi:nitrilase-related carbon-nitrogen hydrolase, partial [uncultured Muribaculum sp.]
MSNILKVGIIQQANTGDIDNNRNRLAEKMRRLAENGARLIVNQELHDSLYFCQTESTDLCGLAVGFPSKTTEFYSALARELGVVIVTSLFERRAPGLYHNTAVVFEADGSIAGKY